MEINSSTINMGSNRAYTSSMETTQVTTRSQLGGGTTYTTGNSFRMTYYELSGYRIGQNSNTTQNTGESADQPLASDLYSNLGKNNRIKPARSSLAQIHNQLLQEIEAFMEKIRNQLLGYSNLGIQSSSLLDITTVSNQPGSMWVRQDYASVTYSESETTAFASTGTVETADGRTIDFNVSMEMSRSFVESSECLSQSVDYILTDPLVIKLKDAPETISDQTFFFDLNCDGEKEEMSQLSEGNGFLALDANGNGVIDDGSELFGTKSGNGFRDLAAYDEDGNGWIDEKDSVYSKLKVWTKDANGKDSLLNLKEADIGAIYLGAAATQFNHNDLETNETKAMVRQTGIYLHESTGAAGYVQQIDFATKPANEVA